MKILVTGTDQYVGSLLVPMLMQRGYEVIRVNIGFYQVYYLDNTQLTAKTFNRQILHLTAEELRGVEAVVHLAEFSNDLTRLSVNSIYDNNYKTSVWLANLAKAAGVQRFIYTSLCNIYDIATYYGAVAEQSPVNPNIVYAFYQTMVEQDLNKMADNSFSPILLQNATAFGASPNMCFDTILNKMTWMAWTTKEIEMTNDGASWCQLVHVLDICKAILHILESPRNLVHNQIFNVGDPACNYQVREIAEMVAEIFKGCKLIFRDSYKNNCNYRVSFEKIKKTLPTFKYEWNAQRGIEQIFHMFNLINYPGCQKNENVI